MGMDREFPGSWQQAAKIGETGPGKMPNMLKKRAAMTDFVQLVGRTGVK
jgi:hypothetical protein